MRSIQDEATASTHEQICTKSKKSQSDVMRLEYLWYQAESKGK